MAFFQNFVNALFPTSKGRIIYKEPAMQNVSNTFLQRLFPSIFTPNTVMLNRQNIENQAFQLASQKLQRSEGYRLDTYTDTRGILTVGIGHKVISTDGLKLGQTITPQQLQTFFNRDITNAFNAAKAQASELGKYEPEMIAALTEVNFQLGTAWRGKFTNTWNALKTGNWQKAIANLQQSAWFDQTPNRVISFIASIENTYS